MQLITTNDGSNTLYNSEFNEHYHSVKCGALNESLQKHIYPTFNYAKQFKKRLKVLDICFGLGYNSFAALLYADANNIDIDIVSPEIDTNLPLILKDFNYPQEFDILKPTIKELLDNGFAPFNNSTIKIVYGDFRKTIRDIGDGFDVVFQDPFSPSKNKTLWTLEYFTELKQLMSQNSVMSTYSQSSSVRLTLKEAGFNVYDLPLKEPLRSGTFATISKIDFFKEIDLEHKIKTNPNIKVLRD